MSTPVNSSKPAGRKRPAPKLEAVPAGKPAPKTATGKPTPKEKAKLPALTHAQDVKDETEEQLIRLEAKRAAEHEDARKQGRIGPWEPEDISSIVDGIMGGSIKEPAPDLLAVSPTGNLLLYRGRVNGIHGHSNAGKSWTALEACKQEMEKESEDGEDEGEHVFYFDHEDDRVGVLSRLLLVLKVDPKIVKERFHYYKPTTWFDQESVGRAMEAYEPSLVVIDAMGGSLSMHDLDSIADADIIKWSSLVSEFIAGHGAAVLILDHLPKEAPRDTLWPVGSQRKKAAITGAQYLQQMKVPFSREHSGYSELICAKDRGGYYGEGEVVAHVKFDSVARTVKGETVYTTRVSVVDPPPKEVKEASDFKKTATELMRVWTDHGPLGAEETKAEFKGDNQRIGSVTKQLEAAGYIEIKKEPGSRKELRHILKPYDGNWTPEEAALAGVETSK